MKKLYLVLIAGVCMVSLSGCGKPVEYERYSSKNPELGLSMDFIAGWPFSEHRGAKGSYAGVIFYENREKDVIKGIMALSVRPIPLIDGDPQPLDDSTDDFISKKKAFKDLKVLSKSHTKLLGMPAVRIEFSFMMPDKIYSPNPNMVLARESVVLFAREGKFFIIRYQNAADKFQEFSGAFSHILKSLEFKVPPP